MINRRFTNPLFGGSSMTHGQFLKIRVLLFPPDPGVTVCQSYEYLLIGTPAHHWHVSMSESEPESRRRSVSVQVCWLSRNILT